MSMLDHVAAATAEYIERMPKARRKKYGQFFTGKETAAFMAEMLDLNAVRSASGSVSILDPGAGSGILSAALIDRLQTKPSISAITLVCYENDKSILELLRENLEWVSSHCAKRVEYKIIADNYILSQAEEYNHSLLAAPQTEAFDFVIGNPPYMKLPKDAPEAAAMQDVCHGAPNLYFLFAAMSAFNLKEGGEMAYIIPRSWTSGAYFKTFRKKFFAECSLEQVHLFASRDKVFNSESVLQETIIIKAKKTHSAPQCVEITATQDSADFSKKTAFRAPYNSVVRGEERYVYLAENAEDLEVLKKLGRLPETLPGIGLKMKTGLIVDFRHLDALRAHAEKGAVPLFYAQHIKKGNVVFPIGKVKEFIATSQESLLQKNSNYLFVKRFTAKEERRRLQCGVYLARKHAGYAKISTQNKLNFICGRRDLPEQTVYGLYVLFNSTPYDRYYRILNGSTQVNATEINSMPVPPMDAINAMGAALLKGSDMSEAACDNILEAYL